MEFLRIFRSLSEGFTNPRRPVARTTQFCTVAPNVLSKTTAVVSLRIKCVGKWNRARTLLRVSTVHNLDCWARTYFKH